MAILTNRGRLIKDLPTSGLLGENDLFIVQKSVDNGDRTENVKFSTIKSSIFQLSLDPYTAVSKFTAARNQFTGSFYGVDPSGAGASEFSASVNVHSLVVRNKLTFNGDFNPQIINTNFLSASGIIAGSLSVKKNITGDIISPLFSLFNQASFTQVSVGDLQITKIVGGNSESQLTGKFIGDVTGNVRSTANNIVLSCGSTNGAGANFYGTASYALKSLDSGGGGGGSINVNTASYLKYEGIPNGTIWNALKLSSAISKNAPIATLGESDWDQLPTALKTQSGFSGSISDLISTPIDPYVQNLILYDKITYPNYMIVRAELFGKAPTPTGDPNIDIINTEPYHASLTFFTDPLSKDSLTGSYLKKLSIIFQRNTDTFSLYSNSTTFMVPLYDQKILYWAASISSSKDNEITSKANCNFSWSYKIHLDGFL